MPKGILSGCALAVPGIVREHVMRSFFWEAVETVRTEQGPSFQISIQSQFNDKLPWKCTVVRFPTSYLAVVSPGNLDLWERRLSGLVGKGVSGSSCCRYSPLLPPPSPCLACSTPPLNFPWCLRCHLTRSAVAWVGRLGRVRGLWQFGPAVLQGMTAPCV